jgi:hypothetical protein
MNRRRYPGLEPLLPPVRCAPAIGLLAILALLAPAADKDAAPKVVPLPQAHAHNDYEHKRPLLDALAHGFCSIEADVYLQGGRLLVGHTPWDLRPERTLEKLYLDPLRERVRANRGRAYPGGPTVYLLVDVKTDARKTYAALDKVLARYADILSLTDQGKFEPKAVTVVISGNRARGVVTAQKRRYAGLDGRAADLDADLPADLMPWISDRWGAHFRWQGVGPMPQAERAKLRDFVRKAHRHGRLVRFWATPERVEIWKELCDAGVDLINTDQLAALQRFLLDRAARRPRP